MLYSDDFEYFFRTKAGLYLYTDDSGNVLTTIDTRELQFTPDGWNEIAIWTERNKKYFGLDRSFTIPLKFSEDGARILKTLFYTQGLQADAVLVIRETKLNKTSSTHEFYHEDLFEGDVDFSTINDEGFQVTANNIEGGLSKMLKANENTLYEFTVEDIPGAVQVKMDGLNLKASLNYVTIDELQFAAEPTFFYNHTWLTTQFVGSEGTLFDSEPNSTTPLTRILSNTPNNDNLNPDNYFFKANANITIRFTGTFRVELANGSYVKLYIKNSNGTRTTLFQLNQALGPGNKVIEQTYNIDITMPITSGQQLYLISEFVAQPLVAFPQVATFFSAEFAISYSSKYQTTYVWALPCYELYKALVEKITDSKYPAYSGLLSARSDLVCISGDGLRGLAGAKIKTSLNQFFNSFNAILNIGLGIIAGRLQLEKKEYWFDSGSVIDLGIVNNLAISSANDFIYNTIKVGSLNQDYDNVNGKDEPNTAQVYTTPVTRVIKELNLVSEYRLDMYGIEFTRINLQGKKTTDSGSDNDTFVLQINKVPLNDTGFIYYRLDRSLNAGATGIIDPPSAFNLGISPKHNLLNHGWYIRSFLWPLDLEFIKFQTTDKNAELVTDLIEKADVLIGALPARKFLPIIFEFETRVPDNLQQLLNANPVRIYQFSHKGITMKGIALKVGIEPSSRKAQVYQLLSTADNDLTQLINFV